MAESPDPPPRTDETRPPASPLGRVGWWRRALARAKPPRRLKLTREGKYFITITFVVGFAAINTGNNLLYLLLGLLLALILISGILSEVSLRHLTIARRLPVRAHVGRPHLVEIEVRNRKGRFPSYAIEVEDLRAQQPADKRCFFLKVSPLSTQVAAYRRTPARRGRDEHVGFRVATRFPFGFFEKSREIELPGELVIYPAVDPVRLPPAPPGQHLPGQSALSSGHGDDLLGVRPFREGDDPHDIYWRKSTTPGQLVIRERAQESRRRIDLVLDDAPDGEHPSDGWSQSFEQRIRDVASLTVAHLRRGDAVTLRTTTGDRVSADRSAGADPLLRFLALLEPLPRTPSLPARERRLTVPSAAMEGAT